MWRRILLVGVVMGVAVAQTRCGVDEDIEPRNNLTWDMVNSRRLKSFDEWLALSGVKLTPEQQAQLEKDGYLYSVVPGEQLPVRHRNGSIEVTPETHEILEKANGLSSAGKMEVMWELGLYDSEDSVHVENMRELMAMGGTPRQHRSALDGGTDAGSPPPPPPPDAGTDAGTDAGVCTSSCSVLVSPPPPGDNSNECHCYEAFWSTDILSDTKNAISKSMVMTATCSWTSACSSSVTSTVTGALISGVADCAGSSTIESATEGSSWSGGAALVVSMDGYTSTTFNQSLEFTIGSKTSGQTRQGSHSQVGGQNQTKLTASGSAVGNVPTGGEASVSASSQYDISLDRKSAATWLYAPTDLTSAHTLNFTMQAGGSFLLDRTTSSKGASITGTAGGCSCAITDSWGYNEATVSNSVQLNSNMGARNCGCSEGTCTME